MESVTHLLYFTKLSGKSRYFYFLVWIHLKWTERKLARPVSGPISSKLACLGYISTNITIAVKHSVQHCRYIEVIYVLHPYDIIMERYAYKKRRMKTNNIPGDPTPISFQTWCRIEWMTRWNSGVSVKWINYCHPLSYIKNPMLYEPILLNPFNAPRQRPDITHNKIWNQRINHNVYRKTVRMKQLYEQRMRSPLQTCFWAPDIIANINIKDPLEPFIIAHGTSWLHGHCICIVSASCFPPVFNLWTRFTFSCPGLVLWFGGNAVPNPD